MKAVILANASNALTETPGGKQAFPDLAGLVLSLEKFPVDEMIIAGPVAPKSNLKAWFEREKGRFSVPITFRFHEEFTEPRKIDPLVRLFCHECLQDSVLLISLASAVPRDLSGFEKTIGLYPSRPVMGIRKPVAKPARDAVSIGERNRIIRFRSGSKRLENEWEPTGIYYFPKRFLSDGIPAFIRSRSFFAPALEQFLSWSVRNFKVYAHVFAAHPGL